MVIEKNVFESGVFSVRRRLPARTDVIGSRHLERVFPLTREEAGAPRFVKEHFKRSTTSVIFDGPPISYDNVGN